MPFKSQAQRGYMYANHPDMAREWEKHTSKEQKLPRKVKKMKNKRKKKASITLGNSPAHGTGLFAAGNIKKGSHIVRAMFAKKGADAQTRYEITKATRYTNHSQDPSARLVKVGQDVHLVASQDINAGSEIFVDYSKTASVLGPGSYLTYLGEKRATWEELDKQAGRGDLTREYNAGELDDVDLPKGEKMRAGLGGKKRPKDYDVRADTAAEGKSVGHGKTQVGDQGARHSAEKSIPKTQESKPKPKKPSDARPKTKGHSTGAPPPVRGGGVGHPPLEEVVTSHRLEQSGGTPHGEIPWKNPIDKAKAWWGQKGRHTTVPHKTRQAVSAVTSGAKTLRSTPRVASSIRLMKKHPYATAASLLGLATAGTAGGYGLSQLGGSDEQLAAKQPEPEMEGSGKKPPTQQLPGEAGPEARSVPPVEMPAPPGMEPETAGIGSGIADAWGKLPTWARYGIGAGGMGLGAMALYNILNRDDDDDEKRSMDKEAINTATLMKLMTLMTALGGKGMKGIGKLGPISLANKVVSSRKSVSPTLKGLLDRPLGRTSASIKNTPLSSSTRGSGLKRVTAGPGSRLHKGGADEELLKQAVMRVIGNRGHLLIKEAWVHFLNRTAECMPWNKQASVRTMQTVISNGGDIRQAIKAAHPNLPAEERGMLRSKMTRSLAGDIKMANSLMSDPMVQTPQSFSGPVADSASKLQSMGGPPSLGKQASLRRATNFLNKKANVEKVRVNLDSGMSPYAAVKAAYPAWDDRQIQTVIGGEKKAAMKVWLKKTLNKMGAQDNSVSSRSAVGDSNGLSFADAGPKVSGRDAWDLSKWSRSDSGASNSYWK
jgi:hypothetical protein